VACVTLAITVEAAQRTFLLNHKDAFAMDHFEAIIKTLLEAEGYWVRQSFKVKLTKEEKKSIGKPSMPRPEIDLLAYQPAANRILAIEAKSYFDSMGVKAADLRCEDDVPEGRYKLFTCSNYREIVLARLKQDLLDCGMASPESTVQLGMVAGHVYRKRSDELRAHFSDREWFYWGPEDVAEKVRLLAALGYENDPAIITAKILVNTQPPARR
jgi:hypothetical protein